MSSNYWTKTSSNSDDEYKDNDIRKDKDKDICPGSSLNQLLDEGVLNQFCRVELSFVRNEVFSDLK